MEFDKKSLAPVLAYIGVLPFIACAGYIVMGYTNPFTHKEIFHVYITYMAIMLSFLAGANWGYAIVSKEKFGFLLLTSVFISFIAWGFILVEIKGLALLALIFGFLAQLYCDKRMLSAKVIEPWFYHIRFNTTAIAIISVVMLLGFSKFGVA